jgi:hypothetical protein
LLWEVRKLLMLLITPGVGSVCWRAGKMGGAMWLWALGQQTERIKPIRPSLYY